METTYRSLLENNLIFCSKFEEIIEITTKTIRNTVNQESRINNNVITIMKSMSWLWFEEMNKNEEERSNDTYELELEGEMKNGIREKTVMKCVSHD